ncbi:MAG: MBL fold metallo-hydrolase [Candidatus Thorarchaeota archaeon]
MVFNYSEGKFNDNSYLMDGFLFRRPINLALYIIENNGTRMLIDTSSAEHAELIIEKLKNHKLYPIHKIFLTHSHWDHVSGTEKLRWLMPKSDIEVLASENAINNLKNPSIMNSVFQNNKPEAMNDLFDATVEPIEDVIPLKEGDVIDLNGLHLEVFNFFGHTMDSIAFLDEKNRCLFTGDAIIDKVGESYIQPTFMPPEFNESELLKTFQKLRDMKDRLNCLTLAHYGVYTDGDLEVCIEQMEDFHFKAKKSIVQWYKERLSTKEIALKYHEAYISDSREISRGALVSLEMNMNWLIEGLKLSGII